MVMGDSQSRLGILYAHMLGAGSDEEEEVRAPELVSTCGGYLEANPDPPCNIGTPRKSLSVGLAIYLPWRGWLPLISQLLPSTSLHFLPLPL